MVFGASASTDAFTLEVTGQIKQKHKQRINRKYWHYVQCKSMRI